LLRRTDPHLKAKREVLALRFVSIAVVAFVPAGMLRATVHQTTLSQNTPHSGERRRNPRLKPPSIIYIEIGSGNGGIVLNLGVGGLAFQAAGKLIGEQDLTLHFHLREAGQSIDLVGGIAWLASTQKVGGIYFKGLSGDMQQEISKWIARQEQACEAAASVSPSFPVLPVPTMSRPMSPGAGASVSSLGASLDRVSRGSGSTQTGKDENVEEVPRRHWVLPASLAPLRKAASAETWIPAALIARWTQGNRLQRLILAGSGTCLGLLLLILTVVYISGSRGGGSLKQITPVPAVTGVPGTSPAPVPTPQRTLRTRPRWQWTASIKELFSGSDDAKKDIDQDQAGLHVWISKRSGYYYCSDSPDYATVQPGALMTQGEALQGGYQPKLSKPCN
jgi:hypothetical protein